MRVYNWGKLLMQPGANLTLVGGSASSVDDLGLGSKLDVADNKVVIAPGNAVARVPTAKSFNASLRSGLALNRS